MSDRSSDLARDPDLVAPLARFCGRRPPGPDWFRAAMANKPERTTRAVRGAAIEILTWGRVGQPGLLFLHGNGAHADWWSHIAPHFAAHHRVAALSWSGMGGSDWRDGYSFPIHAAEARAAITHARLDAGGRAPVVVAHSFGGYPALYLAGHHPALISGTILVDVVVQPPVARPGAWLADASPHPVYPTLAAALARFRLKPPQPSTCPYITDHIARNGLKRAQTADGGTGWTWKFDPAIWPKTERMDRGALLVAARSPLAIVTGGDSWCSGAASRLYVGDHMPPGTPWTEIPNAGHHIMVDQPLALMREIARILVGWTAPQTP